MKCKEQNFRAFTRTLSVLMALLLCNVLVVSVYATEGETTALVGVENVETQPQQEAAEEQGESAEVMQELTEPQPEIDPAVIRETKSAFLALIPEQVKAKYADILNAPQWDLELCREDVLNALEVNLEAVNLELELEKAYEEVISQIQNNGGLSQEEKLSRLEGLEQEKPAAYSSDEFFSGLLSWEIGDIPVEQTTAWMETVRAQITKLSRVSVQLDALVMLQECDTQISAIGDYIDREGADQTRYAQLMQRAAQLREEVDGCLELDEAAMQTLTDNVAVLAQDTAHFAIGMAKDSGDALKNIQTELDKKMILVYVAVGIGAAGVLIAVIAVVLVMLKISQKPELDVSTLASRETAEKLDAQNRVLTKKVDNLDDKLDQQISDQRKETDRQIKEIWARIQEVPVEHVPDPEPAPVPQIPPVETAQIIGYLKLYYSAIAPGNTYLQKCDQPSEYVLYSDNTVEFANMNSGTINSLAGWINNGLLYLYNPVLDGMVVPSDNCSQYSGYYRPKETSHRAKVRLLDGGNYVLTEKGTIFMERA